MPLPRPRFDPPTCWGRNLQVTTVREQDVGIHEGGQRRWLPRLAEPPLESPEVVQVLAPGALLPAVLLQDGEEVLIDFAERRTGIEWLVHPRLQVCLN
jgi:hypothetical protein